MDGQFSGGGLGEREAVARIELPARYEDDLATCILHPAVLDVAAGFVVPSLATEGRVPFLWQDNASRAVAPDCCEPRSVGRTPLGCEHVVVPGHAHVRSWRRTRRDRGLLVHGAPRASVRKRGRSKAGTCGNPLQRRLALGMSSAEGTEVFDRLTGWRPSPHLIVSTVELADVIAENRKSLLSSNAEGVTLGSSTRAPISAPSM